MMVVKLFNKSFRHHSGKSCLRWTGFEVKKTKPPNSGAKKYKGLARCVVSQKAKYHEFHRQILLCNE